MWIAGIDISLTSTGIVKFNLSENDDLSIVDMKWTGFTTKKYISSKNPEFNYYKKFESNYERSIWMNDIIQNFCDDCGYIAIENYSYGSTYMAYDIGEFGGQIKMDLYKKGKKIRLYDICTIKKFLSANGGADKNTMVESFNKITDKFLPVFNVDYDRSKSPIIDIIDSYSIAKLLHTEIKLRHGVLPLKNLKEHEIWCFNRVTKSQTENLLNMPFICKSN